MTTKSLEKLESIKTELLSHPIYKEITTPEKVKIFKWGRAGHCEK